MSLGVIDVREDPRLEYAPPMARGFRNEDIPASDDPVWEVWAETVLGLLSEPRTLKQLKAWAREKEFEVGLLVNALAWLDLRGRVKTERIKGVLTWVAAGPKVVVPLKPLPSACPKCSGRMRLEPERVACLTCGHSIYPPVVPDHRA